MKEPEQPSTKENEGGIEERRIKGGGLGYYEEREGDSVGEIREKKGPPPAPPHSKVHLCAGKVTTLCMCVLH